MKNIKYYSQFINESIYSTLEIKFSKENIDKNIIKTYLSDYQKIKKQYFNSKEFLNKIKEDTGIDALNIQNMSFQDLEKVVDYVKSMKNTNTNVDIKIDGKPIYNDGNIEIYKANDVNSCIKYSDGYSWCIGRKGSNNMFNTYRFRKHEPIFYFVKNIKKQKDESSFLNVAKNIIDRKFRDKYHFFVVQVPFNVDINDVNKSQYIITSAQNGDDTSMSWDDIVKIEPLLSNKQKLFVGV
jgi:hypothetical protein